LPSCPGWDAAGLLWHLSEVQYFWGGSCATASTTLSAPRSCRAPQIGHWSRHSPDTGNTHDDEPTLGLVAVGAPSFMISGTARDVDAWLWNRPTLTT